MFRFSQSEIRERMDYHLHRQDIDGYNCVGAYLQTAEITDRTLAVDFRRLTRVYWMWDIKNPIFGDLVLLKDEEKGGHAAMFLETDEKGINIFHLHHSGKFVKEHLEDLIAKDSWTSYSFKRIVKPLISTEWFYNQLQKRYIPLWTYFARPGPARFLTRNF